MLTTSTRGAIGISANIRGIDIDLDIVINNLLSSAMLYENQLCEGSNITVELVDTSAQNYQAIGSHLLVDFCKPADMIKKLMAENQFTTIVF